MHVCMHACRHVHVCMQARIQGGAKGALPPPSPQKIAPPNSQARIQGGQEGLGPPLQNPGSAYGMYVCIVCMCVCVYVCVGVCVRMYLCYRS